MLTSLNCGGRASGNVKDGSLGLRLSDYSGPGSKSKEYETGGLFTKSNRVDVLKIVEAKEAMRFFV